MKKGTVTRFWKLLPRFQREVWEARLEFLLAAPGKGFVKL
jgi:hypothetical protein